MKKNDGVSLRPLMPENLIIGKVSTVFPWDFKLDSGESLSGFTVSLMNGFSATCKSFDAASAPPVNSWVGLWVSQDKRGKYQLKGWRFLYLLDVKEENKFVRGGQVIPAEIGKDFDLLYNSSGEEEVHAW